MNYAHWAGDKMTDKNIKITCWGPRGSLPSPSKKGFSTTEFGGNTSCYHVEAGPFSVILDCGSGIRDLGNHLMATGKGFGKQFIVPLSHYHWDHIQGLPFCVPMFIAGNKFYFHGFAPSGHERGPKPVVEAMLGHQQSNPHFLVAHTELPAERLYTDHARQFSETFWYKYVNSLLGIEKHEKGPGPNDNPKNWIKFTTIPLNHPDGCLGYKIEYMGKSIVYATDNEPLRHTNAQLDKHAQLTDWLLLDGQYSEEQIGGMTQTFGHGTPAACIEQAKACLAALVVIHHHDPANDDKTLTAMEKATKRDCIRLGYAADGLPGVVEFAREGVVWEI
jgi:phosphoribosyl 1,2-cyclic phosphodiesterase